MSHIPEIYEHIVVQSPPHRLPGRWSKLPAGPAYVDVPADSAALLTSLCDRYARRGWRCGGRQQQGDHLDAGAQAIRHAADAGAK